MNGREARESGPLGCIEDRLLVPAAVNFAQPMLSPGVVGAKDDGELASVSFFAKL